MSLTLPARRRDRATLRARRTMPRGIVDGTDHVATDARRVYVVAYYRSPQDAREVRGGIVTTFADHATAPERVLITAPGPGPWFVSILERGEGPSGFTYVVGAEASPLIPR